MGLGGSIRAALRNIRRQKTRSFLTIFAIVIGSLAVTIMLALTLNATSYVRDAAERTGLSTRVFVTGEKGVDYYSAGAGYSKSTNKLTQSSVQTVSAVPHVAAVAGLASTPFQRLRFNGVEVRDMRSVAVQPTGAIAHSMLAGRDLTPEDTGEVVLLSSKMAQNLGFDAANYADLVGQTVTLVTDQWYRGPGSDQTTCSPDAGCGPTPLEATVLGIYEGDSEVSVGYDWAYRLSTETYQEGCVPEEPGCGPDGAREQTRNRIDADGFGSIVVRVDDEANADAVAKAIQDGSTYGAVTGRSQLEEQTRSLTLVGLILLAIGAIALLVSAIGVVNTMVMATLERTREIGVMRALGATKRTIRRMFTVEAATLGFLGGLVGILIAIGLFAVAGSLFGSAFGDFAGSASGGSFFTVKPVIALIVVGVTTLVGTLSGALPARRAARLDPVEALRYE